MKHSTSAANQNSSQEILSSDIFPSNTTVSTLVENVAKRVCWNCLSRDKGGRCQAPWPRSGTICSDTDKSCKDNFDPRMWRK
jgi:hypothetical protein